MPRYVDKKADQLKITFRVSSIALQNYKYVKKKLQNMSQAEFGLYLITLAQKYESGELIKDVSSEIINQELISTIKQLLKEGIVTVNPHEIQSQKEALPTSEKPIQTQQINSDDDDFEIVLDINETIETTKESKKETSEETLEEQKIDEKELAIILEALAKRK